MSPNRHRTFEVLGQLMTFHAFPGDVEGKFCLVETVVPPGAGAPPNHHAGETEAFFVLDGVFDFFVDDTTRRLTKGDFLTIPDGAVHGFTCAGETAGRLLILNAPGLMHEAFFTALGTEVPATTRAPAPMDGPPDLARVLATAESVGMTIMAPARA